MTNAKLEKKVKMSRSSCVSVAPHPKTAHKVVVLTQDNSGTWPSFCKSLSLENKKLKCYLGRFKLVWLICVATLSSHWRGWSCELSWPVAFFRPAEVSSSPAGKMAPLSAGAPSPPAKWARLAPESWPIARRVATCHFIRPPTHSPPSATRRAKAFRFGGTMRIWQGSTLVPK